MSEVHASETDFSLTSHNVVLFLKIIFGCRHQHGLRDCCRCCNSFSSRYDPNAMDACALCCQCVAVHCWASFAWCFHGDAFNTALALFVVLTCLRVPGGVFGLAGTLPFKYTQGIMGGQALGGVLVSVANILSLEADTAAKSAIAYFATSVAVLIGCLLWYACI